MAETIKTNRGDAQSIQFADGRVGWQLVNGDGSLAGLITDRGQIIDPLGDGNTSWSLCEATDSHREAMQVAVNREQYDDFPFQASGFQPSVHPEI